MRKIGLVSLGLLAAVATACSTPAARPAPAAPTTTVNPADQAFVDQVNKIEAKYPAENAGKGPLTTAGLKTFLSVSCPIATSGLANGPEWTELARLLKSSGRCPANG